MKKIDQSAYAIAFLGQALAYPFLIAMALQVNWTFQLVALLFMTICLAGTTLVSSNKLMLLLVVAILGYVQQRINFIAIGGMFIIVTVINSRRPFKLPRYIYQFSPLIMTLLLYLARMHG